MIIHAKCLGRRVPISSKAKAVPRPSKHQYGDLTREKTILLADHHHTGLLINDFASQTLEILSLRRLPISCGVARLAPQAQRESIS